MIGISLNNQARTSLANLTIIMEQYLENIERTEVFANHFVLFPQRPLPCQAVLLMYQMSGPLLWHYLGFWCNNPSQINLRAVKYRQKIYGEV